MPQPVRKRPVTTTRTRNNGTQQTITLWVYNTKLKEQIQNNIEKINILNKTEEEQQKKKLKQEAQTIKKPNTESFNTQLKEAEELNKLNAKKFNNQTKLLRRSPRTTALSKQSNTEKQKRAYDNMLNQLLKYEETYDSIYEKIMSAIEITKIVDDLGQDFQNSIQGTSVLKVCRMLQGIANYNIITSQSNDIDMNGFIIMMNTHLRTYNSTPSREILFQDFAKDKNFNYLFGLKHTSYIKMQKFLSTKLGDLRGAKEIYYKTLLYAKNKNTAAFNNNGDIMNLIRTFYIEKLKKSIDTNENTIFIQTLTNIQNLISFSIEKHLQIRAILLNLEAGKQLDHDLLSVAGFVSYLKNMSATAHDRLDKNSQFFRLLYENFSTMCVRRQGSPQSPQDCRGVFDYALPRTAISINEDYYKKNVVYTQLINAYGALVHGIISYAKVRSYSNVNRSLGNPKTDFTNGDIDLYNYLVNAHNGSDGVLLKLRTLLRQQGFRELVYIKNGKITYTQDLIKYQNGRYTSRLLDYFTKPDTPPPEKLRTPETQTWRDLFLSVKQ